MIKVEHGVPIPLSGKGGHRVYPFNLLKKGDSFFVTKYKTTNAMGGAISNYRRVNKAAKFTMRAMKGGVRVWRIQ